MTIQTLAIGILIFLFLCVIEMMRRDRLTFKYAAGWFVIILFALILVLFDQLLFDTAYFLGFELPSNFIFFTMLVACVFFSLVLTMFLCQQNKRNDAMAQKIAIVEAELNQLKKKRIK